MEIKRHAPLNSAIATVYEREMSEYPDRIRVAMDDGSVIDYRIEIKQPHPACEKAIDSIRRMTELVETFGGYKYKGAKTRKRTGRTEARADG